MARTPPHALSQTHRPPMCSCFVPSTTEPVTTLPRVQQVFAIYHPFNLTIWSINLKYMYKKSMLMIFTMTSGCHIMRTLYFHPRRFVYFGWNAAHERACCNTDPHPKHIMWLHGRVLQPARRGTWGYQQNPEPAQSPHLGPFPWNRSKAMSHLTTIHEF